MVLLVRLCRCTVVMVACGVCFRLVFISFWCAGEAFVPVFINQSSDASVSRTAGHRTNAMPFTTLSGRPVVPSAAGRARAEALGLGSRMFPRDAEGRALPVPEPRGSRDAISEALELDVSELQWKRLVEDVNAFVYARDAGQLDARSLLVDRFRTTLGLHQISLYGKVVSARDVLLGFPQPAYLRFRCQRGGC